MRLQGVIQIGGTGGQFLAHFKKTVKESRYEVRSELGHLCTFDWGKNYMVSLAITSPFQLVENEDQIKNMK